MAFLGMYWGEENNPARKAAPAPREPDYDRAPKRAIDPRTVEWANTRVSESHVQAYIANPNRYSDDGDPYVVIGTDGKARGHNGKHRATAAMRTGRKLRARVSDLRDGTGCK